jgi:hypothetical protein
VSSSGPDGNRAWLQVGAGALKHCVALGCIPEATLLQEAIRAPKAPVEHTRWKPINTSFRLTPRSGHALCSVYASPHSFGARSRTEQPRHSAAAIRHSPAPSVDPG